ncbi:MAG: hypothetical protein AB1813_15065, partial [Verrucomicrobiota bacterium]
MNLLLELRHDPSAEAVPDAWFFNGPSTERWIEELARCGLAESQSSLYVVARSLRNASVAGLLVVPPDRWEATVRPAALGLKLVAGRLYVPVDACLFPQISDPELRQLCPWPVALFHPAFGLSGFDSASALHVWDLMEAPSISPSHWNYACAGESPMPGLQGISVLRRPTLDELYGDANEEIGSEPAADLPPAPNEPKPGVTETAARKLERLFLTGLVRAFEKMPRTAPQRTWLNDVEDWAHRKLSDVREHLEGFRGKELRRLLHMLEEDPERGLRHAIPLNAFGHRGAAPPTARLGPRSIEFDPQRLGGQAVDCWDVPLAIQEQLRRRYREMADREMRLGRCRRAAYIYAELLGDLLSAAHALKQGGFYREAAVLYEEQLRNGLEAARCLAEGGLLLEAIQRYEKMERWLDAADLYERLGNTKAAHASVRRVIDERLLQDDVIGAARLLEERLCLPDEAVAVLQNAWPLSKQSAASITALFKLYARLGRHDDALGRLARLGRDAVDPPLVLPLLQSLGNTARNYPHTSVRHAAADLSRVLAARELQKPGLDDTTTSGLVSAVVRLEPDDRLLERDANRFLAQRRAAQARAIRITPPPLPGPKPDVHRRFELPRQIQWLKMRSEWHWFFALGVTPKHVIVLRGIWEGEYQTLSWPYTAETVRHGMYFESAGEQGNALILALVNGAAVELKRFPATDRFFSRECLAGTPTWFPSQGFPFAIGEEVLWTIHVASGQAVLACHQKRDGHLLRTIDITNDLLHDAERSSETRLSLAAIGNSVAVALGNRLVLTSGDGQLARVDLPGQAKQVVATPMHTRRGVAVMLDHGAVMHWLGMAESIHLDRDLVAPMGAFVPGGP